MLGPVDCPRSAATPLDVASFREHVFSRMLAGAVANASAVAFALFWGQSFAGVP